MKLLAPIWAYLMNLMLYMIKIRQSHEITGALKQHNPAPHLSNPSCFRDANWTWMRLEINDGLATSL